MNPTLLPTLRTAYAALATPYARLRAQVLAEARAGGVEQVRRAYPALFARLVGEPKRQVSVALARRVAQGRLDYLATELRTRYPERPTKVHAQSGTLAIHQALRRPRWEGTVWPSDVWVQGKFLRTLDDWQRRAQAKAWSAHTLQASGAWGFAGLVKQPQATPQLDPRHRKIAYPFGDATAVDEVELVERALDNVVMARGEYYAAVGLRDLATQVDQITSRIESGQQPFIIGWRWNLSPEHTEEKCRNHICLTFSEADVGHPSGPGVYFDAMFPQSHPNCWCTLDPEYADDTDLDDPTWTPPQPDEGYEDRVVALVEQFHDMLASAHPGPGWSAAA